jgi:basic membrane protein A
LLYIFYKFIWTKYYFSVKLSKIHCWIYYPERQRASMKKIASILLITMILLLTACGGGKISYVGDSPNVALIIANRGDKGFNDSAVIGMNVSVQDHGTNLTILEHDNNPDNYEKVFMDAAKGYNHVIITSSMMKETLEAHAAEYPDVKFLMYDGEVDWDKGDLSNVYCIIFSANEVSYLAGYLAAAMSKTSKIGFVGGMKNTNIDDFAIGFEAGAKEKNPSIQISLEYADSFNDQEKGKEIAKRMADGGVDIIFSAAGAVNLGVLDVVAENDLYMIGVDTDQYALFKAEGKEDLAKCIITSAMKDIGDVLYGAVDNYTKREVITGESKTIGLAEGGVSLAKNDYYKEIVPQAIQDEIDELEDKIIKGEIEVPTARKPSP